MKLFNKYRIIIENEATLEKKFSFTSPVVLFFLFAAGIFVVAVVVAALVLSATPLKDSLPGYLKESERTATVEQHQRLDSMIQVYQRNEAYIAGLFSALNPPETDSTKFVKEGQTIALEADSLLPTSPEEKKFLEDIRERDKFNISISALGDAEALMFENISQAAIFPEGSEDKIKTDILIPSGAGVEAVAEGKIISVAISKEEPQFYEVIIQHPKGFLSKTGKLSSVMVSPGARVSGGQIIGLTASSSGKSQNIVSFELWQDGKPLPPMKFLHSYSSEEKDN